MFQNSGSKLKVVARVLMVVMIIACIGGAIYLFVKEKPDIFAGIMLIVGGFFAAWFGSLTLYAIGVSAEKAQDASGDGESLSRRISTLEHKLDVFLAENEAAAKAAEKRKKKEK